LKAIGYLALALLIFGGCATAKQGQQEPPGFIGKVYQNTTTRFNAYYNSNQLYVTSLKGGEDGYQEDYSKLLPVSIQEYSSLH